MSTTSNTDTIACSCTPPPAAAAVPPTSHHPFVCVGGTWFRYDPATVLARGPHTTLAAFARYLPANADAAAAAAANADQQTGNKVPTKVPPSAPSYVSHPGNPRIFAAILTWYRTGQLHVPLDIDPATVRHDLDYWNIPYERDACVATRDPPTPGYAWLARTYPRLALAVMAAVDGWIASPDFRRQTDRGLEATWTVGPPRPKEAWGGRTAGAPPRSYKRLFDTETHRTMAVDAFHQRGLGARWDPFVVRHRFVWPETWDSASCVPRRCHVVTVWPLGRAHAAASMPVPTTITPTTTTEVHPNADADAAATVEKTPKNALLGPRPLG